MAKKKGTRTDTKSAFLRKVLDKNPELDHREVNRRWAKAGHDGEISSALFYQVRSKMGIRTVWQWVQDPKPGERTSRSKSETKARKGRASGLVYQLKITLKDVSPPVWRRVRVADCPLDELHEIIQVVMGWDDYHMYEFAAGDMHYTDPRGMDDLDMEDASTTMLGQVVPKEGFKLTYTYDFGDDWRHEVLVEKIEPAQPDERLPMCVDGKRACPPEDVGGPWGYAEFRDAIGDPKHERHEELMEWSGEFDPEAFDRDAINRIFRES